MKADFPEIFYSEMPKNDYSDSYNKLSEKNLKSTHNLKILNFCSNAFKKIKKKNK